MGSQDVEWVTPESLLQGIRRWQRMVTWTAGSGSALGLLLGAVTLAGMLLTGVRERIPEIGLRRALGARRREIAGLFVVESLVLTIAAALAGIGAAEEIGRAHV
jgi:putative ABC transport system permease protein